MRDAGGPIAGSPMERRRTEKQRAVSQLVVIQGGQLHEEIVGMLAIHDGVAECGFSLLEKLG